MNTNRQREISNKQLNEEYRIKLFFSQQSSSLEPLDIFDMPFHPRSRPNHMSQLKLAARNHRLLMERYLKLNEVGYGSQPTGVAIAKPKNNGLLIQKPKSNKSVTYKNIEPHAIDHDGILGVGHQAPRPQQDARLLLRHLLCICRFLYQNIGLVIE